LPGYIRAYQPFQGQYLDDVKDFFNYHSVIAVPAGHVIMVSFRHVDVFSDCPLADLVLLANRSRHHGLKVSCDL
jgi:hypothetical protein